MDAVSAAMAVEACAIHLFVPLERTSSSEENRFLFVALVAGVVVLAAVTLVALPGAGRRPGWATWLGFIAVAADPHRRAVDGRLGRLQRARRAGTDGAAHAGIRCRLRRLGGLLARMIEVVAVALVLAAASGELRRAGGQRARGGTP
ncbi:hypothetical protein EV193_102309 [Herbihabitans rhizosphaerae]|uniref:Uncharacterized protein n=1 Tax=Herbihabitans rhizosphaerae TaxID=1872711 RepID=A0A4Q7L3L1_9PSEU|nr:hypothetical protein [Herbihabitans rhizosphaerae]RZS43330.1 hypothetical protein EV193_102309 [Herbihabitans rhizosphaerae]